MSPHLGKKSQDCLRYLAMPSGDERLAEYWRLAGIYSEKAVDVKCEQLASRGYSDYGVAAVHGWLTDKGKAALA